MELDQKKKSERAVAALRSAPDGLTKNDLARAIWGMVTSSTQSMTTRLTQSMLEDGIISEQQSGRRRVVRLTRDAKLPAPLPVHDPLAVLHEVRWRDLIPISAAQLDEGEQRPSDRPYAQLERAARWVASVLDPKVENDQLFGRVVLRILTYSGDAIRDAAEDRREIEDFIHGWNHPRKRLSRAIAVYGLSRERDFMAPELLDCADDWGGATPESLLWAAMALGVSRRLWLIGGERAEEHLSKLTRHALRILKALRVQAPVHVAYWRAFSKGLRGDLNTANWKLERGRARISTHTGKALEKEIRADEDGIILDARYNAFFSRVERFITGAMISEVERRIGFARRFRHDEGATPMAAESWARDQKPVVTEIMRWTREKHRSDRIVRDLAAQVGRLREEAPAAALSTRLPTFEVVEFLSSGDPDRTQDKIRRERKEPLEYTELIRNNFWSPSMLWADIALSNGS